MRKYGENLFRGLSLGLCLLLLTASMLYGARKAELNDRALRDEERCRELRRENSCLQARCACSLSLQEIERYAREELGMQPLCAEQILRADRPQG